MATDTLATPAPALESTTNGISADEIALYDRQIRLWGVAAQERLRRSRTLVVSCSALADEVVKNLVLAGVGGVTLLDDRDVTVDDFAARFLLRPADIGRNRALAMKAHATELNPRVRIDVVTTPLSAQSDDYLTSFDCVVAIDQDLATLRRLNAVCRSVSRSFYAAECPGLFGYVFCDLVQHDFTIEVEKVDAHTKERRKVTNSDRANFVSLDTALASDFAGKLKPKLKRKVEPLLPCFLALLSWRETRSDAELESDKDGFAALVREKAVKLGLPADHVPATVVDAFVVNVGEELSAVVSVVGGVLAQDILNSLSGRERPLQNMLVYNGDSCEGPIYNLV